MLLWSHAQESEDTLLRRSAISEIIEIPLKLLFFGYSEQNYEQTSITLN